MDEDTRGWLVVFAMAGALVVGTLGLIAFVVAYFVPVELPIVLLAVLTGAIVEVLLLSAAQELLPDSDVGTGAVQLLAGAGWITGVFLLSTILGRGLLLIGAVVVALVISSIALVTLGARAGAKNRAADRAASQAQVLRGWERNLADDPELHERLRAAGWRADGPIDESRATYLRVWEELKLIRRAEGRAVWPSPRGRDQAEQSGSTDAITVDAEAGSAPRDP